MLRELRAWSGVPVLILSGATDRRRRVEALDSGADDYVQKPFSVDELMARVRALLRRSSTGEASAAGRVGSGGSRSTCRPSTSRSTATRCG